MDDLLDKILKIADLTNEEIKRFTQTFYFLLTARVISAVSSIDQVAAVKLESVLEDSSPAKLKKALDDISVNPELKEKVDKAIEEVFMELTSTIAESSTEEQKRRILAILPS